MNYLKHSKYNEKKWLTWYPFGDIMQKTKLLTILLLLGGLLTIAPDIRAGDLVITAQ